MFTASDFRLCISSYEFSLVFDSCRISCPSCGSDVSGTSVTEVRISSLLVLVGVGCFLCYKLIFGKQKQEAKSVVHSVAVQSSLITSPSAAGTSRPEANVSLGDWRQRIANWSSTPNDRRQSLESETSVQDEDPSFLRSFSICSANGSIFGDQTVAKLDILLDQIQDIKKSVGEMDAELLTTRTSQLMSRITSVDDSTLFDANETSPPTPTLEWDSNDINDITLYNDDHIVPEEQEAEDLVSDIPVTKSAGAVEEAAASRLHLSLALNPVTEERTRSPPSPSSSSGKGSMASSPDEKSAKEKRVRDILAQAERQGVVNDLLDVLLESAKRDSAFFEN